MAQAGIEITGLDIMPQMLAHAREKAAALPIRWVEADMRSFDLGEQFPLILETGWTFQHLLDRADQEAALARVRAHLAPGGRFVVSALFPRPRHMADEEEEDHWFSYKNEAGGEVRVTGTQTYDPLRQVRVETAHRRWKDAQGQEVVRTAPLALRLIFPQEMEALLHYNGLAIEERYGDWDCGPLTGESNRLIYICRNAAD
jgi:SAM-dependent methyltransferase